MFLASFPPGGKQSTPGLLGGKLPGGGGKKIPPAQSRPYPRARDGQDLRTRVQRERLGAEDKKEHAWGSLAPGAGFLHQEEAAAILHIPVEVRCDRDILKRAFIYWRDDKKM